MNEAIDLIIASTNSGSAHKIAISYPCLYSDTLKVYDTVISKYPDFADAWDNRGWILRQLGRYAEALISHDKALQLKPTNPFTTWFNRGIILELLQRPAESKTSYQQAINSYNQLTPEQKNDPENLYLRGWVFFLLQLYPNSINSLQQAIQLQPTSWHLFNWVFPLFSNFSQERIYLCQQLAKSLDEYPHNIVQTDYAAWQKIHNFWCKLGQQWEQLNHWQDASIAYDRALAIKPDSTEAMEGKKRLINWSF
ncbi:tetratricopeptide repeat protein [Nostoc sp. 2RC]|uniref:tetratricopeptide repeat protein n=1 Tax=Nostoc sp. 2RC TaxID=2485484 RepID=UPI0016236283|nr:tetratricopeptide repeat protein [Nostoc sp. 2RC]